jgi:hypothetical protein
MNCEKEAQLDGDHLSPANIPSADIPAFGKSPKVPFRAENDTDTP